MPSPPLGPAASASPAPPVASGSAASRISTPPGVLAALAAWYVFAGVVVSVALDAERVASVSGVALGAAAAADVTSPSGVLGISLGAALIVGCLFLLLGHWFALRAMVPLALVAVLAYAAAGSWLTLVLMACLVLGTAPLLTAGALRHLRGPA